MMLLNVVVYVKQEILSLVMFLIIRNCVHVMLFTKDRLATYVFKISVLIPTRVVHMVQSKIRQRVRAHAMRGIVVFTARVNQTHAAVTLAGILANASQRTIEQTIKEYVDISICVTVTSPIMDLVVI